MFQSSPTEARLEQFSAIAVLASPIVYLSVRHGIHVCFFFLLLLAVFHLARNPASYRHGLAEPWIPGLLLAFASLFLATAITQLVRLEFYGPSYDGPSRILLAAVIFLFLRTRAASFARLAEVGIPLGLLALFFTVQLFPDTNPHWEGRLASHFVDPNSLGSQSLILTLLCLFSVGLFGRDKLWLLSLKAAGVAAGIYITIHAQSRGGWLAAPPLLVLWLMLHFGRMGQLGDARRFVPVAIICAVLAAVVIGHDYSTIIPTRIDAAYGEIGDWLTGRDLDTSSGIRMSIWKLSLALAKDNPWHGYGEVGFQDVLENHSLNVPLYRAAIATLGHAGPHSDPLAKLLSMGLIGLSAYIVTLALPWAFFWTRRADASVATRAASHLGMYLVIGVFVCGLTNEMLSLKYLCSFFGLMIAGFASDVAKRVS